MQDILGTSPAVYIGVSVVIGGGAALMTGIALARTWRPVGQMVMYAMLLAAAARFLIFALFEGELLSLSGYLCDLAAILALGLVAYRATRAEKMVSQYPWLYERSGLFGWRDVGGR